MSTIIGGIHRANPNMNKLPSKIQFFNKNMANKDNVCPIKSIRDDMAGCCRASNIKFIIFKTNVMQK